MAILVSDNTNASYTNKLSAANGFYISRAYNFGPPGANATSTSLANSLSIPVTFTGAGAGEKVKGVCLAISSLYSTPTTGYDRSVTVDLQEVFTPVTISIATPCVVTFVAHGLADGTEVVFETTGALPTGLTVTTTKYYTRSTGADTLNLYTTYAYAIAGGATGRINTSGTQSGTHSMWVTRTSSTKLNTEINPGSQTYVMGAWYVPFKFATPYTIDTTASKWRFRVSQGSGTSNWYLCYTTAGNYNYTSWGDATATFSSGNDALCVVDKVVINQTATLKPYLGTGMTTLGCCGIVCANSDISAANTALLEWENPASASYTLTIDGHLLFPAHSGFRVGTAASPITYANQANIVLKNTPTAGTTTPSSISGFCRYYQDTGQSLFFYGEVPTYQKTTLVNNVTAGSTSFTTTDATGWKSGDLISLGRENLQGQGRQELSTLNGDASGTTINITSPVAGSTRIAGGQVVNYSRYGVKISNDGNGLLSFFFHLFNNLVFSGCYLRGIQINTGINATAWRYPDTGNYSQWLVQDCGIAGIGASTTMFTVYTAMNPLGLKVNRCNFHYSVPVYIMTKYGSGTNSSGSYVFTSNTILHMSGNGIFAGTAGTMGKAACVADIENNVFENGTAGGFAVSGNGSIYKNNSMWGMSGSAIYMYDTVNPTDLSGNIINNCGTGINFPSLATVIGAIMTTTTFGNITANTADVTFGGDSFFDFQLSTPTGFSTITTTYLPNIYPGSNFRVTNAAATNDDRVYGRDGYFQRTGSGLTDTTVHTAGGYAIRFQSTSSTNRLTWQFNVPTGNIQNKEMTFIVWCYINSASYYAGTHEMPRIAINYDNGSYVYGYAGQTAGGWQRIPVTFTPTTTYGQITISLTTMTDATGSNTYVYWDDVSVLYPAGVQLNLGTLDLWANALPVLPPIATNITAKDVSDAVWDDLTTDHNVAGSFGVKAKSSRLIVDGEILV